MKKEISIIWSPLAQLHYIEILSYIIENWSINDAHKFDDKTNTLIDLLKLNQSICPKSHSMQIRKCVITRQTSMIYRNYNHHIEIIDFISNYSRHSY